jgi:DNA replication protein DnaC
MEEAVNANPLSPATISNAKEWFAPKSLEASAPETASVQPSQFDVIETVIEESIEACAATAEMSDAEFEQQVAEMEQAERVKLQAILEERQAKRASINAAQLWNCQLCFKKHDATVDPSLRCTTPGNEKRDYATNDGTTFEQRRLKNAAVQTAKAAQKPTWEPSATPLWERATKFANIPDAQYEWLADGWFPKGELIYLTGDFGSFKTFIAMFTAEAIASGKPLFNRETEQHPVLILDRENSRATLSLRRDIIGDLREDLPIRLLSRFTEPRAPELDNTELLALCKAEKPLVIVDSFQDFHDGLSESNPDDMTKVGHWLDGLIDAGAVGVIVLHHVPKNQNGRGGKYRGSTSIIGGAGAAFLVEKTSKFGVSISAFKTRDGENVSLDVTLKFPSEAAIEDKTGRVTYSVGGSSEAKRDTLRDRILVYVKKHPGCSKRDVARNLEGKTATTYAVIKLMLDAKTLTLDGDANLIPGTVVEPSPETVETVGM